MLNKTILAISGILLSLLFTSAVADEGMWTFDNLPLQTLKERYHFEPTSEWIKKVRLASLRFNDGGSGSFVSAQGLVLTNHHVALGQLQKVSTPEHDYVKNGFYAHSQNEELKCPDLEINQLISMQDVTQRVQAAIPTGVSEKEQNIARKAEIARIEAESTKQTGLRSDVIELYKGGEYWLYRYKKYTDIRLVMAPEAQAAQFGGDPDNFTYPRYALDFAFFRIYENGKPVQPQYYLKWSKRPLKENELVFVSGHPGATDRLDTVAQLEFDRDYALPSSLRYLEHLRQALDTYASLGAEQTRRSVSITRRIENSLKALKGMVAGLQDQKIMHQKITEETVLREKVKADSSLNALYGASWDKIAKAEAEMIKRYKEYAYRRITGTPTPGSVRESALTSLAGNIVRYVVEVEKPNDTRYEEFRDSALESMRMQLLSEAPIYPDLEEVRLAASLRESVNELGVNDPFVKLALNGHSPEQVAKTLISGTKLADPQFRKQLLVGGRKAVETSDDPLIVWARRLDPSIRDLRKWYEDNIQSVETLEGTKIAKARFAVYGKTTYPDATFTLRLAFGKVAGYQEEKQHIPYQTIFKGLFERAAKYGYKPPYDLPAMVKAHQNDLNLNTPVNFVSTNDITGGNSGSPVINKDAELVGLIFDGNIQSLTWDYVFNDEVGRAVSVDTNAILEALRKIYGMNQLADELVGWVEH